MIKTLAIAAVMIPTLSFGATSGYFASYNLSTDTADNGTHLIDRSLTNSFSIGMNLSDNFYISNKFNFYPSGNMGYSLTYGGHDTAGYLRPYGEVSYNTYDNKMHYDIGTTINLTQYVLPFVEVDDFLSKDDESFTAGAAIKLYKKLYLKASYEIVKKDLENNFSVGVYVDFL